MRTKRSARCAHFQYCQRCGVVELQIVGFMIWQGFCQTAGNCRLCVVLAELRKGIVVKQNCMRSRSSRLARVGCCSWFGYMVAFAQEACPGRTGKKVWIRLLVVCFLRRRAWKPWLLGGSRASCDADRHAQTVQKTLAFMLCVFLICSSPRRGY